MPVPNVSVDCSASIKLSKEGEPDVTWTDTGNTKSNDIGIINLYAVQTDNGFYKLSLDAKGIDGDRYVGELQISGNEAVKVGISPIVWKVTRKRLSLVIRCIWDPEFSKEPFRPEVYGHAVVLNDKHATTTALDIRDSTVIFYDLPPGKYRISFMKMAYPTFNITRSSEEMEIPADAKLPITHILTLKPIALDIWKLHGVVRDSESGQPVSGAYIYSGGKGTKSGDDGTFVMEVLSENNLVVQNAGYESRTFPLPAPGNSAPVALSIQPYPFLSGRLLAGNQKPSVQATLTFESTGANPSITCNKEGEFRQKLKPGAYQLRIEAEIGSEHDKDSLRKYLLLFSGPFVMPKNDLNQDFKFPAIAKVAIQAQWSKDVLGKDLPEGLVLLRESDKMIMAAAKIAENAETILYAVEGKYTVLAVARDKLGALCGEIDVAANDETVKRIHIPKWTPFKIDKGIPRFTAPSPQQ
jgi:hypothetical protein